MQTKKIEKCNFSNEWKSQNGSLFFHTIELEGDVSPWNIASKTKDPDFLQAGQLLTFTIKDESKRTITRVQADAIKTTQGGNDYGLGAMVGNAITNATHLVAAGNINVTELEAYAEKICEISVRLKDKFQ